MKTDMAFKLTKDERKEREDIAVKLDQTRSALDTAVIEYNEAVKTAFAALQEAIEPYNEAIEEAREFTENVASRLEDEISDKSDKWQESDRGNAAAEMRDEWQNFDAEKFEPEEPEEMETGDIDDVGEKLNELPEEIDA